jgi:hypothetical protein
VRWRTFHATAGQSRAPPLGLTDFWKKRRRSSAASLRWDITTSRVIDNHNRHYQITKIAWFPKSPRENFCFLFLGSGGLGFGFCYRFGSRFGRRLQ